MDYCPFHIWDVILPIDELHHFSRWLKHVKTTNQICILYKLIVFPYHLNPAENAQELCVGRPFGHWKLCWTSSTHQCWIGCGGVLGEKLCHWENLCSLYSVYIYIHTLHDITLHTVTLHTITYHYIALRTITVHYITLHYVPLQYITLHTNTHHYITLHYIHR